MSFLSASLLLVGSSPKNKISAKTETKKLEWVTKDTSCRVLAYMLDILNMESADGKNRKWVITFHDPSMKSVEAEITWLSLWGGHLELCNKDDIKTKLVGRAIYGFEGPIQIQCNVNGEKQEPLNLAMIASITPLKIAKILIPSSGDSIVSEPVVQQKPSQKLPVLQDEREMAIAE